MRKTNIHSERKKKPNSSAYSNSTAALPRFILSTNQRISRVCNCHVIWFRDDRQNTALLTPQFALREGCPITANLVTEWQSASWLSNWLNITSSHGSGGVSFQNVWSTCCKRTLLWEGENVWPVTRQCPAVKVCPTYEQRSKCTHSAGRTRFTHSSVRSSRTTHKTLSRARTLSAATVAPKKKHPRVPSRGIWLNLADWLPLIAALRCCVYEYGFCSLSTRTTTTTSEAARTPQIQSNPNGRAGGGLRHRAGSAVPTAIEGLNGILYWVIVSSCFHEQFRRIRRGVGYLS